MTSGPLNGKQAAKAPLPGIEMSEEMLGAFQGVVEDHSTRGTPGRLHPPPAKPVGWIITTAGCWATLILLLLFQPAIVRTPRNRTFVAPEELRTASLRFGLWLARQRLDAFMHSASRLPGHLGEAGIDDRTILLEPNGQNQYTLIGRDGSIALRLTSEMSTDSFLGNSLATLAASRAYQQAGMPGLTTAR